MEETRKVKVKTEKELADAVKNEADTIEIEGDLRTRTLRIKATGKVAWGVCIAALAVSITAILATPHTAGSSNVLHLVTVPVAASILGGPVAISAMLIAVAGGGIGVLNKLRNYKIVENSENTLILKRK